MMSCQATVIVADLAGRVAASILPAARGRRVPDDPRIGSAIYGFGHVVHPFPPAATRSLPSLAGRIEWTVLRAMARATTEGRRELLMVFLDVWAASVFAGPDAGKFPGTRPDAPGWGTADHPALDASATGLYNWC